MSHMPRLTQLKRNKSWDSTLISLAPESVLRILRLPFPSRAGSQQMLNERWPVRQ